MRIYNFDRVIGNTGTVNVIKTSLRDGVFNNFTIFSGLPGTGKSTCAEISALALTCEHPIRGNPCLVCNTCKTNLEGLKKDGIGKSIIKKNIASIANRKDIDEMVKEIFKLQSPEGNSVYILEEFHTLNSNYQTMLLEELDRLASDVYVIICTTKIKNLLPELKSRSITFTFNRLNDKESLLLYDMLIKDLPQDRKPKRKIKNLILERSRGIPRELTLLLDYVSRGNYDEDDICEAFHYISTEVYTNLLQMMSISLEDTISYANEYMDKDLYTLVDGFKSYMIQAVVYLVSGNLAGLPVEERKILAEVLDKNKARKICSILERLGADRLDQNSLMLALIDMQQVVEGQGVKDAHLRNRREVSRQVKEAKSSAKMMKELEKDTTNSMSTLKLNSDILFSLGTGKEGDK